MALQQPKYDWVVRYHLQNNPTQQYNFSGFKEDGDPGYAFKFDNIEKFKTADEAFKVVKTLSELNEGGKYVAQVSKIHIANGESYYFTNN